MEARRAARICLVRQLYYHNDPLLRREVAALLEDGFIVDVLCMRGPGEAAMERDGALTIRRLPLSHVRAGIGRYLYEYAAFLALAGAWLTALHLRRPYDVIQVNTPPDSLVFAALVPKLLGTPVVLHLAETMPEFFATKFKTTLDHPAVRVMGWVERFSIAFAGAAITCTAQMRDGFTRRGSDPRRIDVVLNSADESIFDPARYPAAAPHDGEFVLICHGTMEERYGLDTAISAVALLKDEIPGLRLRLIGGGTYRPTLERMAGDLGVADRVEFSKGWVTLDELVGAIAAADAGVVAMKRDAFRDVTHCNKMFDFITMRKPALVSRTTAVEAYFGDDCFEMFESSDAADLARAIRRVHADPARREELVRNAAARNESYRWPRQRAHYLEIVRRNVGARALPSQSAPAAGGDE